MVVGDLSPSAQDHLRAIWNLQERSSEPVTVTAVASQTGLKLSTASGAITKLVDLGLVVRTESGALQLTAEGRRGAIVMVRRHRLLETFLVTTLGYRWDQVDREAESLEHAVSDFLIERIDEHLGFPTHDPHGDPIPNSSGHITESNALALHDVELPATVRITRVSDADRDLLRYLAEHSIVVGTRVRAEQGPAFSQSVCLKQLGKPDVLLGESAIGAIWVQPSSDH